MDSNEITCVSFCTGYGGLEMGLRRVLPTLRTIAYAEIEEYVCAVLAARMEEGKIDVAPIWTNIKTFPSKEFHRKVHILVAGFPCQPFSVAGQRRGEEDPRHLWPYIKQAIGLIQPIWVFLENVPGLINLGLRNVLLDLEELGYRVETDSGEPTWGLFTATEVGAPHKRERLFILANTERYIQTGRKPTCSETPCGWTHLQSGGPSGTPNELADTETAELTGGRYARRRRNGFTDDRWPSRPGHPQYEWEEPRVVDDSRSKESTRVSSGKRQTVSEVGKTGEGQTKPQLGRAVNGTASGLDKSKSGVNNNEKVLNVQQADSRQEQVEQEILQQPVLWQVNNDENADKRNEQEKGAKSNQVDQVPKMQQEHKDTATPRRLQQTTGSGNTLPEMPHQRRSKVGAMGQSENRIDRLRLLGNGVVPQLAELAFRTLIEKFSAGI